MYHIGGWLSYLKRIEDERKRCGIRDELETILVLMIMAKLCGQYRVSGIAYWGRQRSEFLEKALGLKPESFPHHSTYRRVLADEVDAGEVKSIVGKPWSQLPRARQDGVVGFDVKTVRGTITCEDSFGLHLRAAYCPGEGIVLLPMVDKQDREKEIVAA